MDVDLPVNEQTMAKDGFHPNKVFYSTWADRIKAVLSLLFWAEQRQPLDRFLNAYASRNGLTHQHNKFFPQSFIMTCRKQ